MTAPVQAPENTTSADTRSAATDHGPRTTDSARAGANRLNARKSTGPRTPEGKAKSALNALKHGLTSHSPLLPTEDPADYQLFADGYLEELDPQTIEQFTLAQQLITVSWKLSRIPQIEAKVLATQLLGGPCRLSAIGCKRLHHLLDFPQLRGSEHVHEAGIAIPPHGRPHLRFQEERPTIAGDRGP